MILLKGGMLQSCIEMQAKSCARLMSAETLVRSFMLHSKPSASVAERTLERPVHDFMLIPSEIP